MNRKEIREHVKELKKPDKNRDAFLGYYTERDLSMLLKYLPKRCSVLDAGGGYGRLAILLAKKGYKITVLDPVRELLELAEIKAKREKANITTVIGDVTKLPFKSGSFDAVIAMRDVLNYSKNYKRGAKEAIRVCRKGGVIVASGGSKYGRLSAGRPINDVNALFRSLHGKAYPTGEGFNIRRFSVAELKSLFAGQKILEVTGDSIVMPMLRGNAYNALKKARKQILEIDKELAKEENLNFFDHIILVARKV